MKTAYQIANEIGKPAQTIYQKIEKLKLNNNFEQYITTNEKGKTLINEAGEEILKNMFSPVEQQTNEIEQSVEQYIEQQNNEIVQSLNNVLIDFYKEQIDELKSQLQQERETNKEKDRAIIELAEKLAQITHNTQLSLQHEQQKNTFLTSEKFTGSDKSYETPSDIIKIKEQPTERDAQPITAEPQIEKKKFHLFFLKKQKK